MEHREFKKKKMVSRDCTTVPLTSATPPMRAPLLDFISLLCCYAPLVVEFFLIKVEKADAGCWTYKDRGCRAEVEKQEYI